MLGKSQAEPKLHGLPEGFRGCLKESQLISKIRGGGAILEAAGWEETLCRAQEWKSAEPCCTQIRKRYLWEQRWWERDGTFRLTENYP